MYRKCCVENCASVRQDVKLHQFPASEIGLQKWLQCINSDRLRNLSIQELRKVFVCHKHFERRFITPKNRILLGGYPTLFSQGEIESGVPSPQLEADLTAHITFDHCYDRRRQHEDHTYSKVISSEIAGCSQDLPPAVSDPQILRGQHTVSVSSLRQLAAAAVPSPQAAPEPLAATGSPLDHQAEVLKPQGREEPNVSDSLLEQRPVLREIQNIPCQSTVPGSTRNSTVLKETPDLPDKTRESGNESNRKRKRGTRGTDSRPGQRKRIVPRVAALPPYCRKIYDEYKKSKKQLDFMKRAKRAMTFSKTQCFEKLTSNLNPLARKMIWMQITQSNKKQKGRRFTEEEK
ncbi:uncharacterized protein LOC125231342 [Leguminivora glycinivorella]|uniref:uncharacterized protein LOC125231342 n=1 Tax=Leguminivora glycinivorella TaxID=1035111 RepID=UPI00200BF661|nr:uncharacterized protein LOC125231342 [Leguminivora glycinivorella]